MKRERYREDSDRIEELMSSREGRKRTENENRLCKARRDKEAEMDKAGQKMIEKHAHKWSNQKEGGIVSSQRPETRPVVKPCRGGGSLSASDELRVAL